MKETSTVSWEFVAGPNTNMRAPQKMITKAATAPDDENSTSPKIPQASQEVSESRQSRRQRNIKKKMSSKAVPDNKSTSHKILQAPALPIPEEITTGIESNQGRASLQIIKNKMKKFSTSKGKLEVLAEF
jgi:hypothetical protein